MMSFWSSLHQRQIFVYPKKQTLKYHQCKDCKIIFTCSICTNTEVEPEVLEGYQFLSLQAFVPLQDSWKIELIKENCLTSPSKIDAFLMIVEVWVLHKIFDVCLLTISCRYWSVPIHKPILANTSVFKALWE